MFCSFGDAGMVFGRSRRKRNGGSVITQEFELKLECDPNKAEDLKRRLAGAQSSISQRGDAGNRFAAATFGKNFADDRANITLAYEFNEQDQFKQTQRLNYGMAGPTWRLVANPADGPPGSATDDPNVPDRIFMTDLRW